MRDSFKWVLIIGIGMWFSALLWFLTRFLIIWIEELITPNVIIF